MNKTNNSRLIRNKMLIHRQAMGVNINDKLTLNSKLLVIRMSIGGIQDSIRVVLNREYGK